MKSLCHCGKNKISLGNIYSIPTGFLSHKHIAIIWVLYKQTDCTYKSCTVKKNNEMKSFVISISRGEKAVNIKLSFYSSFIKFNEMVFVVFLHNDIKKYQWKRKIHVF